MEWRGGEEREGKGREGKGKKLVTAVDNLGNQENRTFKTSLSYIIRAISDCLRSLSKNCNNKILLC